MQAMVEGIVSAQYHLSSEQDYVSLFLFEDTRLMDRVLEALEHDVAFTPFREHFLFASIHDVHRNVLGCWRKVGNDAFLFHFIDGSKAFRLKR